MLIDTHCHVHEASYPIDSDEARERARQAGVEKLICVGTDQQSSLEAVEFANTRDGVYASIGVHPHESSHGWGSLNGLNSEKIVAIGEIGLDYYYTHSPREIQIEALEAQLHLATNRQLPVIFHVRNAFKDFWPILDNFSSITGVLHSFTDTNLTLENALSRGFLIGVNGISVFTKDKEQQSMFASIPLDTLLLETDAPFLTPPPFRGKVNEPAFVKYVAEHHARVRNISYEQLERATFANATALFAL